MEHNRNDKRRFVEKIWTDCGSEQFCLFAQKKLHRGFQSWTLNFPSPFSWWLQVWAMELSRRCLSLLNSQDGGILTVSFSGMSGVSILVSILLSFSCRGVLTFWQLLPLIICGFLVVWWGYSPQNNAHKHKNTDLLTIWGLGDLSLVLICGPCRVQEPKFEISFLG